MSNSSRIPRQGRLATCPDWCVTRHSDPPGEDDQVHLGHALLVRRTVLRLWAFVDPHTGVMDGPYVLMGHDEYTLHEGEALIDALTQLVDEGRGLGVAEDVEGALSVLDAELAQHGGDVDPDGGGGEEQPAGHVLGGEPIGE